MLEKKHKHVRKVIIALAVIAVLILLIAKSCSNQEDIDGDVRKITVTFEDLSTVYGDPLAEAKWEITGNVEPGDEVLVTPVAFDFKFAGTYEITGTAVVSGESGIVYDVSIEPGTYTVTKRQITIHVDDKESIQGEPLEDLSGKVSGTIIDGDDLGILYQTDAGNIPGEYKITATIENSNYEANVIDGTYTIKPAGEEDPEETPTPTPGQTQKPEGTPTPTPGQTQKPEETPTTPTPTPTPPTEEPPPVEDIPKTVRITVTFTNLSTVYGDALATAKWTVTGSVEEGDKLVVSPEKFNFKNAGTYEITGTVRVDKTTNTTYVITVVDGVYTVKQRPITIQVDDKQSVEGKPLKTLTGKVVGTVIAGDDLGIKYQKAPGTAPGKYDITATISNPNYIATIQKGIYTITADSSGGGDDDDDGPGTGNQPTNPDPGLPGNPDDEDDTDNGDDDNPSDTGETPSTTPELGPVGDPDDEDDTDNGDDDNPSDTGETPSATPELGPVGDPDEEVNTDNGDVDNPSDTGETPDATDQSTTPELGAVAGDPAGEGSTAQGGDNPSDTGETPSATNQSTTPELGAVGGDPADEGSTSQDVDNPSDTGETPNAGEQPTTLELGPVGDSTNKGSATVGGDNPTETEGTPGEGSSTDANTAGKENEGNSEPESTQDGEGDSDATGEGEQTS